MKKCFIGLIIFCVLISSVPEATAYSNPDLKRIDFKENLNSGTDLFTPGSDGSNSDTSDTGNNWNQFVPFTDEEGRSSFKIQESGKMQNMADGTDEKGADKSLKDEKATGYEIVKRDVGGKPVFERVLSKDIVGKDIKNSNRISYRQNVRLSGAKSKVQIKEGYSEGKEYIRHIYEDSPVPNPLSWGVSRIGADIQKKSDEYKDSPEIIVAILDTGADYKHSYIKNRLIEGYDFVDQDNDATDENFHGTHVAGIIASSTPDNVKIMPVRVLDENGYGEDANIANGIVWAVDHDAKVINMSLGGPGYSKAIDDAVKYAESENVLVVVAAGNESDDTEGYFPASIKECLTVSATDKNDQLAKFSNHGASVDLAAPGVDINSCMPGDKYAELSGTSMATPFVSACAAITMLKYSTSDAQAIESILENCSTDLGTAGWDEDYGNGLVDITNIGKLNEPFILLSPKYDKQVYDKVNITFSTKGHTGGKAVVSTDGIINGEMQIKTDGFYTYTLDVKNLSVGAHNISIQMYKPNKEKGPGRTVKIDKIDYNCSLEINDIEGNPVNAYTFQILGLNEKDEEVILDSGNRGNNIYNDGEYIHFNLDFGSLNKKFKKITVIATENGNSKVPIYIRSISSPGNYVFSKDKDTREVNVKEEFYDASSPIHGVIGVYAYLEYNNRIRLGGSSIVKLIDIKGESTFYTDDENILISSATSNFYYDRLLRKGEKKASIVFSKDEMVPVEVNIPGDKFKDSYNNSGFHIEPNYNGYINMISLGLRSKNEDSTLDKKVTVWITPGEYRLGYFRYVIETGKQYYLSNYYKIDKEFGTTSINFGGTLKNNVIVDYSYEVPKIKCEITDSWGNCLDLSPYLFQIEKPKDFSNGGIYVVFINNTKTIKDKEDGIYVPILRKDSLGDNPKSYDDPSVNLPWYRYDSFFSLKSTTPITDENLSNLRLHIYYNPDNGIFKSEIKDPDLNLALFDAVYQNLVRKQGNVPPKYIGEKYYTMEDGETFSIPVSSLFKDSNRDQLELVPDKGTCENGVFEFKAFEPGVNNITITAFDYKSAPVDKKIVIFVKTKDMVDVPKEDADYNLRSKSLPESIYDGARSSPIRENYQENIPVYTKQLKFHLLYDDEFSVDEGKDMNGINCTRIIASKKEIWDKQLDYLDLIPGKTFNFISLYDDAGQEVRIKARFEDPYKDFKHGEDDFLVIDFLESLRPDTWYTLDLPKYYLKSFKKSNLYSFGKTVCSGGKIIFKTAKKPIPFHKAEIKGNNINLYFDTNVKSGNKKITIKDSSGKNVNFKITSVTGNKVVITLVKPPKTSLYKISIADGAFCDSWGFKIPTFTTTITLKKNSS